MGAFFIALMLMGAGYGIGNHSFETLRALTNGVAHAHIPTRLTAVAALISIVSKEILFRVRERARFAGEGRGEKRGRGGKGRGCTHHHAWP